MSRQYEVTFWRKETSFVRCTIVVEGDDPVKAVQRVEGWGNGDNSLTIDEEGTEHSGKEYLDDSQIDYVEGIDDDYPPRLLTKEEEA